MQSLGFTTIQNGSIRVDPHGLSGADNSHYIGSLANYIAFGEGGVDDAEDADVIWHEYGHAIIHSQVTNWNGGETGAMGEGFGDYFAASYSCSSTASAITGCSVGTGTIRSGAAARWTGTDLSREPGGADSRRRRDLEPRLLRRGDAGGAGGDELSGVAASFPAGQRRVDVHGGAGAFDGGYQRIWRPALWALSDALVPRGLLSRPANDVCPGFLISPCPIRIRDRRLQRTIMRRIAWARRRLTSTIPSGRRPPRRV